MRMLRMIPIVLSALAFGACQTPPLPSSVPGGPSLPQASILTHTPAAPSAPTLIEALSISTQPQATLAPSLTPLPTMSPPDAESTVMKLLQGNAGCSIPCWWGIVPGVTPWEAAKHKLAQFARITAGGSGYRIAPDGHAYFDESWAVEYDVEGEPLQGSTAFSVVEGKVFSIDVRPIGTHLSYSLSQLLTKLGKPEDVRIEGEQIGDGSWPFRLYILYPRQGVFVFFDAKARPNDGVLTLCLPPYARPELYLQAPQSSFTVDDVMDWQDPSGDALPLAKATRLTVANFYERHKDSPADACLTTPAIMWVP